MTDSFSILFYLKKTKRQYKLTPHELEKEKIPIYCRVTVNGGESEFSVGESVERSRWVYKVIEQGIEKEDNKQRVLDNKEDAKLINKKLDNYELRIRSIKNKLEDKLLDDPDEDQITADLIITILKGKEKSSPTLIQTLNFGILKMKEKVGVPNGISTDTIDCYGYTLNNVREFLAHHYGKEDIQLKNMLNPEKPEFNFAANFEHYGMTATHLKRYKKSDKRKKQTKKIPWISNYIAKQLSNIKTLIQYGVNQGWIVRNPLEGKIPPTTKGKPKFITQQELLSLENAKLEGKLEEIRDLFLFSCYTGMAYAEIRRVTDDNISRDVNNVDWIFIVRKKTRKVGKECKIPIIDKAQAIINKYKDHPVAQRDGTLLPVPRNQHYNIYLKHIMGVCGIKTNLTTHVARHTCAIIFLDLGFTKDFIAEMLGHTETKLIATIYGAITPKRMSREIDQNINLKRDENNNLQIVNY